MKKLFFAFLATVAVLGLVVVTSTTQAKNSHNSQPTATSIRGVTTVSGQEVVVEVIVAISPGENARSKSRAVLRRAYPDVREIESENFATTGLLWDQFGDLNPGNDFVTVNYNPKGVPGNLANHRNHWTASQDKWANVASSTFVYADGGDTSRCPSLVRECKGPQKFDGNNDVGWIDIKDPSVLGVTWWGTSTDELDMALDNKNFTWYTGNPNGIPSGVFDTETVWLHEFGHGLGLGHSNANGAVMEPYYEGLKRTLYADDINGISFLYPTGGATPTPTLTPTPTATPTATPTPTITPTPTPVGEFTLSTNGYKVKGVHHVDLSWSGATGTNVDVKRNGVLIYSTANDDFHTDNTGNKGGNASYTYEVCESGSSTCSNSSTANF